jgi:hypothetical protein
MGGESRSGAASVLLQDVARDGFGSRRSRTCHESTFATAGGPASVGADGSTPARMCAASKRRHSMGTEAFRNYLAVMRRPKPNLHFFTDTFRDSGSR